MTDAGLPEGWREWNDEPGGRKIIAYRPDVFQKSSFPDACMPTLVLGPRPPRGARPEARVEHHSTGEWYVTLFLEPEVILVEHTCPNRETAVDSFRQVARDFSSGAYDLRDAYQIPREDYLHRLDELVDQEP